MRWLLLIPFILFFILYMVDIRDSTYIMNLLHFFITHHELCTRKTYPKIENLRSLLDVFWKNRNEFSILQ